MLVISPQTRTDFDVEATRHAFAGHAADMAQFPMPSAGTIVAAEMLARSLTETSAPDLGAVGVAEYTATGLTTYYAVSSGFGEIPDATITDWNLRLNQLANSFHTVCGLGLRTHAIFYSPAHVDTVRFIEAGVPAFDIGARRVVDTDVDAALTGLRGLPDSPIGTTAGGDTLPNLAPTKDAIQRLLSCAVAVRIDATNGIAGSRLIQGKLRSIIPWLDNHAYGDRANLARNIEALANTGGHPAQFRFQENPNLPISTQRAIQRILDNAWRVADLNRFCAEPKLFTYLGVTRTPGALTGQVAMWWDSARPNRYKLNGDPGIWADYMLPCTSCQGRSTTMLAGLATTPPTENELPTLVLTNKAQTRQRRNSIG